MPLHPSVTDALTDYAAQRDRLCPAPRCDAFFLSTGGVALTLIAAGHTFTRLTTWTGLRTATCSPRMHDLRHAMAVRTSSTGIASPTTATAASMPYCRCCQRISVMSRRHHILVSDRRPGIDAVGRRTATRAGRPHRGGGLVSALAPLLQSFFTERLIGQRRASPHTIAGYRDTFRLLLRFAADRTGTQPSRIDIGQIDAPLISAFLDHLEHERGNSVRTRNNRLAAIHSLFGYGALRHPEHAATIARVLAIPTKRCDRNLVSWLTEAEVDALLAAPDRNSWAGRRDHAMLTLAAQTGLRISELTGLTIADIHLGTGAYVHCLGKGRKERATPLTPLTVRVLRVWLGRTRGAPRDPLFPTITGQPPEPRRDRTPPGPAPRHRPRSLPIAANQTRWMHTLRHSAAMRLLESGTDVTVIALWLGHEHPSTTARIYLHADMTQKQKAIARVAPAGTKPGRYRPSDTLLAFLDGL